MSYGQKEFQQTIKDLNKTLAMDPKLNPITTLINLKKIIVDTIAPLVEAEDPRVQTLQPSSIEAYNFICAEITAANEAAVAAPEAPITPEAGAEAGPSEKAEAAAGAGEEGGEPVPPATTPAVAEAPLPTCEEYGKNPDKADAECKKCNWLKQCLAIAKEETAKAKAKAKAEKAGAKAAKEPKAKGEPRFTRHAAVAEVLKANIGKVMTRQALTDASNKVYAEHGGKANDKEAKWAMEMAMKSMLPLGHIVEDATGLTYKG